MSLHLFGHVVLAAHGGRELRPESGGNACGAGGTEVSAGLDQVWCEHSGVHGGQSRAGAEGASRWVDVNGGNVTVAGGVKAMGPAPYWTITAARLRQPQAVFTRLIGGLYLQGVAGASTVIKGSRTAAFGRQAVAVVGVEVGKA